MPARLSSSRTKTALGAWVQKLILLFSKGSWMRQRPLLAKPRRPQRPVPQQPSLTPSAQKGGPGMAEITLLMEQARQNAEDEAKGIILLKAPGSDDAVVPGAKLLG